jgi:methionyl-tRNA formyltransferase
MRVLILTSFRYGTASSCLPALCGNPNVDVAGVVLAHGGTPNRKRALQRKISKTLKIGLLGALNGVRLRKWYDESTDPIEVLAARYQTPLIETPYVNSDETRKIFRDMDVQLGLSLGNGYIGESVFSIPRYGMINVHGEILPDFQGAQSVIWSIYEGKTETGFTVHQIDRKIDTGQILYQEKVPIELHPTLRGTVEGTLRAIRKRVPEAVSLVSQNYEELRQKAKAQSHGKSYTTPSIWQFRRMLKNHHEMYRRAAQTGGPERASTRSHR